VSGPVPSRLSLCAEKEGRDFEKEEEGIRTGTLVDPQTEEVATKYMGLNIRNRI